MSNEKVITKTCIKYICSKCGKEFNTIAEAEKCSNTHCDDIVGIQIPDSFKYYGINTHPSVTWYGMTRADFKSYPDALYLKFSDGSLIRYRMDVNERDRITRDLNNVLKKTKFFHAKEYDPKNE